MTTTFRLRVVLLAVACSVGSWILVAFFATSEFYRRSIVMGGPQPWNEVFDYQMTSALNWAWFTPIVIYIAQRLPLRKPDLLPNALTLVAYIPVLAILRAGIGGALMKLGEGEPFSPEFVVLSIGIRTHRNICILVAIFFVNHLVEAQREAARRERQRVRAQTLLTRMELEELRTRFQPQFAVRMLRHIGRVLHDQPAAADGLIVTLSGILRRSIARDVDERIRLADELEHFDRCLGLCRAGGCLSVHTRYVAEDDVLGCRVPALVLQQVIESVVLDLTAGDGGSVEVQCHKRNGDAQVQISWSAGGTPNETLLRIPCEEAFS